MRREFSVPERLGGLGLAVGLAAAGWPAVTASTGFGLPCALRWLTGIPCPACGLTAAAVALVHGDPVGAFAANPTIFGLAAFTLSAGPLLALRALGVVAPPAPWSPGRRRAAGHTVLLLAFASWVFQIHRLGLG